MRTNRLRLLPDRAQEKTLRVLGERVSALWNAANYACRQRFVAGEPVPGYPALCARLQTHGAYRALPSDVAQEVLKKLSEAWTSYFGLRARWKAGRLKDKPGLPRYRKRKDGTRPCDFIPIKCGRAYAVEARSIAVTLPADLRGAGRLVLPYRGLRRYSGKTGRAEIAFDAGRGRWYFRYAVDRAENALRPWARTAALDLGVRVATSLSIDGAGPAFHYLGRDLIKEWDYWNRRIAEHMAELAHRLYDHKATNAGESIRNEQQADRFAAEVMQRTPLPPLGMLVWFLADAHQTGFPPKRGTHPLSGERVRALADHIDDPTLAQELRRLGREFLDDPDIRAGFVATGKAGDGV